MGRAKPVILPSIAFPTQKAALDWVRDEIKNAYPLEGVVTDPLHDAVLRDLLDRDDDAAEKVGDGVREFFIRKTEEGPGNIRYVRADARGIWIRRVDGTVDDWSYQSAIRQEGRQSDVKDALRAVVSDERIAFRERAFGAGPVVSAQTGLVIARLDDAEVRYESPTWGQLTSGFVASEGGWDAVRLTSGDGHEQIAGDLADPRQRAAWIAYWLQHARPILVEKPHR